MDGFVYRIERFDTLLNSHHLAPGQGRSSASSSSSCFSGIAKSLLNLWSGCTMLAVWPCSSLSWRVSRSLPWKWSSLESSLLLLADSYVGLIFWTALSSLALNLWWFALEKEKPPKELCLVFPLVFIPTGMLGRRRMRQYFDDKPSSRVLMVLCGVAGAGGQIYPNPSVRLILACLGAVVLFVYLFEGVLASNSERRQRVVFSLLSGAVLFQALTWAYIGQNPLISTSLGVVFLVAIPGLLVLILLAFEGTLDYWGDDDDDEDDRMCDRAKNTRVSNGYIAASRDEEMDDESLDGDTEEEEEEEKEEEKEEEEKEEEKEQCRQQEEEEEEEEERVVNLAIDGGKRDSIRFGAPMGNCQIEDEDDCLQLNLAENGDNLGGFEMRPMLLEGSRRLGRGGYFGLDMVAGNWMEGNKWLDMFNKPWKRNWPWLRGRDELGGSTGAVFVGNNSPDASYARICEWLMEKEWYQCCQIGVGFGSFIFLMHWLLLAPTLPARWARVCTWWGLLSVGSLLSGICVSAEMVRDRLPKLWHRLFALAATVIGGGWMLLGSDGKGGHLGAALIATSASVIWELMTCNLEAVHAFAGTVVFVAITAYCSLLWWSASVLAYQQLGGKGVFSSVEALMACVFAGIGIGLARDLGMPRESWRMLSLSFSDWGAGQSRRRTGVPTRRALAVFLGLIVIILAIGIAVRMELKPSNPGSLPELHSQIRILNLNVHQGFNRAGGINFEAILEILKEQRPHFIMLQESDTMHIVHGNQDMVDFLATRLKMHSLYTPATRFQTWGCAMLSLLPLRNVHSEVLPSPRGEKACFQHATVSVNGCPLHLMNAHFGNVADEVYSQAVRLAELVNDTMVSVPSAQCSPRQTVDDMQGNEQDLDSPIAEELRARVRVPLIVAGDFNLAPLTPPYDIIMSVSGLIDARVTALGNWNSSLNRDRGAGLVFASQALRAEFWEEPVYDQQVTTDGFPLVVTFHPPK